MALVSLAILANTFGTFGTGTDVVQNTDVSSTGRQLLEEQKFEKALDSGDEWQLIFYVLLVMYMFLALAILCDEFFVPALEVKYHQPHRPTRRPL